MKLSKKVRVKILGFLALFMIAVVVQALLSTRLFHPDRVVIWVFDVGQGDAIFIDGPDAQVLIDGGSGSLVLEKLSAVMPFWDRSIDLIVSTHPHADHVGGLVQVLERYAVGDVWVSGQDYSTEVYSEFELLASERNIVAGESFSLGAGAILRTLWPEQVSAGEFLENTHDANLTLLLEYGSTNMLLTGDMEAEIEMHLLDDLQHVDVLKVGHHGSRTSSSVPFLEDITPNYAIISVGADNDYGHPHEIVLDHLSDIGSIILRTDRDGDVRIVSDGTEPSIATFDL